MSAKPGSVTNLTGLLLSAGCVVHCMLMPLCIASLPKLGMGWLASSGFHQLLAVVGIVIGVATLLPGWRLHRRHRVLAFAATGLTIMNVAAFGGENCCAESCCQESHSEAVSTAYEVPVTNVGTEHAAVASPGLISNVWEWLWAHPTAFGAALLAMAHFMNGSCSRSCCGQDACSTT
ncbi:MAG: MerC domain-containing protein [Planctomycetaceae bacterium]